MRTRAMFSLDAFVADRMPWRYGRLMSGFRRRVSTAYGAFATERNDGFRGLLLGGDSNHAKYTTKASACSRTQNNKKPHR